MEHAYANAPHRKKSGVPVGLPLAGHWVVCTVPIVIVQNLAAKASKVRTRLRSAGEPAILGDPARVA